MAERRMASSVIMQTDQMLSLKPKTILLYLYLIYHADDDGLLGNTRMVLSLVKATKNHLEELANAGYILKFDSGVIAIAHWRMHNQVRKVMYKSSIYLEERSLIYVKKPGVYTLFPEGERLDDILRVWQNCSKIASQNSAVQTRIDQDSIGQGSLDQDSIDEDSIGAPPARAPTESSSDHDFLESVLGLYQRHCTRLKPCEHLSKKTAERLLELRQKGFTTDMLGAVFYLAGQNDFLAGGGENGWVADLAWLSKEENLQKVRSGEYAAFKRSAPTGKDVKPSGELGRAEEDAIWKLLREDNTEGQIAS